MPLRVVHIDTERTWRGGEAQLLHLAKGLSQRGHRQWIVGQPGSPLLERAGEEGLETVALKMSSEFSLTAIWRLARLFEEHRIQVIHMHTSHSVMLAGLAARWAGVPVRVMSRRVDFTRFHPSATTSGNPFRRFKYRWNTDRIIAISKGVHNALVQDGIDPARVVVIYDACPLDLFDPTLPSEPFRREGGLGPDMPVIGNVAHFADHKGHRYLVEAAQQVIQREPRARFVLVGDGDLRAVIEEQVKALGLDASVIFTGFRADIPQVLAAFDLFVLSSHMEGMGSVLLEAMAMGRPIVATRVGGIPELIEDGVEGLLVPPRDPKALAGAILSLLADPDKRLRMGLAGRRKVAQGFSVEQMVAKTEKVYLELFKAKQR